jgi:hypothetical protein
VCSAWRAFVCGDGPVSAMRPEPRALTRFLRLLTGQSSDRKESVWVSGFLLQLRDTLARLRESSSVLIRSATRDINELTVAMSRPRILQHR